MTGLPRQREAALSPKVSLRSLPSSLPADRRSPFRRIHIPCMLREEPPVTLEVLDPVLAFAVDRHLQLLNNPGSSLCCSFVVLVNVVHKDSEHLRPISKFRRTQTTLTGTVQHQICLPKMRLDSAYRVAVAVGLPEAKNPAQPVASLDNV